MSNQNQRPTLQGQKIKTRKRDEKEKYDPGAFRDAIILGLDESNGQLDQVTKFLDSAGSRLDYRRYAETLLDVLFAGGILAPGGSIVEDPDSEHFKTDTCIFGAQEDFESLKAYYEVFYKLIRRYKYIEKTFDAELKKLLLFLKGFSLEQRRKLATTCGICLANGLGDASCLQTLFEEHLVKDGIAMDFATSLFGAWLREKDLGSLNGSLKKAGLDGKLMNLLPINKRNIENFAAHFKAAGLDTIVEYQRSRASADLKKGLQKKVAEMLHDDEPVKEIIITVKDEMEKVKVPEHEVIVMVWNTVMNAMEWSKKEEQVLEQSFKHLRMYTPLFSSLSDSGRAQVCLLVRMQDYCYENMVFMKAFNKIVVFFYKNEVLSEEAILRWYRESHSQKGKSIFLEQMKKFIEWLENAEEESEEDD